MIIMFKICREINKLIIHVYKKFLFNDKCTFELNLLRNIRSQEIQSVG